MYHGSAIDMGCVQIVLLIDQKRLQKKLMLGPDQVPHFRHRGWDVSRSGISNDCHVCYAEQCRAGFGTYHPAGPQHKSEQKNVLNNVHGDFFESGIRACPESVGVGKFCRLRLRLRAKQPTPTDSDSGSDSDSAALLVASHLSCYSLPCLLIPSPWSFYPVSPVVCVFVFHLVPVL